MIQATQVKRPKSAPLLDCLVDQVKAWERYGELHFEMFAQKIGDHDDKGMPWIDTGTALRELIDSHVGTPEVWPFHKYFNKVMEHYGDS